MKVQLDAPPPAIRPGFSVSGEIETDRRPGTVAIPIPALVVSSEEALVRTGKGRTAEPTPAPTPGPSAKKPDVEGVFLAKKDGTVEFRKVKTGINAELQIEVLSGLSAGDEIVSGPFKALRALKVGDRVKVDNTGVARDESKKSYEGPMLNSELVRVALRAIGAHKLRSFLTLLLGVIIGVMTVVAVIAVISGLNNYIATKLFTLSPDVYVVTRFGIITSREQFLEALKRKAITKADLEKAARLSKTAVAIGAQSGVTKPVKSGNRRLADVQINGTTANVADLQNLDVEAGRFFTETENERRAYVAVIGSEVREELFARVDPIGRDVAIGGIPFRIVGLLVKQGSVLGQSKDNVVYIPREALAKSWGTQRSIGLFVEGVGRRPRCHRVDRRDAVGHLPDDPPHAPVGPRPGRLRHRRGGPGGLEVPSPPVRSPSSSSSAASLSSSARSS